MCLSLPTSPWLAPEHLQTRQGSIVKQGVELMADDQSWESRTWRENYSSDSPKQCELIHKHFYDCKILSVKVSTVLLDLITPLNNQCLTDHLKENG